MVVKVFVFTSLLMMVGLASSYAPIRCNRPNEYFDCGSACQNECATLGQPCPIVNIVCNNDCYCIDGYARDSITYNCIPEEECSPPRRA